MWVDGVLQELTKMNAFKLDLMTLLAIFVVLAVIVTMALGSGDNEKASVDFTQPRSTIGTISSIAPGNNTSFSYRTSQTVMPSSKFAGRSWQ